MESITKAVFTSKLNSVTDTVSKNLNFGDDKGEEKEEGRHLTSKELRKIDEQEKAERAKRDEAHAKKNAERQKTRDAIRAKYGIEKQDHEGEKRRASHGKVEHTQGDDEKSCSLM